MFRRVSNSIYWVRGLRRYSERDYEAAIRLLQKVGPPFDRNKKYLCLLGNGFLFLKNESAALDAFEQSLRSGWHSDERDAAYLDLYAQYFATLIRNKPVAIELKRDLVARHASATRRIKLFFDIPDMTGTQEEPHPTDRVPDPYYPEPRVSVDFAK